MLELRFDRPPLVTSPLVHQIIEDALRADYHVASKR